MKSFWLEALLRIAQTALGLLIDHRAKKADAAKADSTAGPSLPATAVPAAGIWPDYLQSPDGR